MSPFRLLLLSFLGGICTLGHAQEGKQTAIFINEIHYANTGQDIGEFIEIAGPTGTRLNGWHIAFYNGHPNKRNVYATLRLKGEIPNQCHGFGTLAFPHTKIQNGAPDGLALVNPTGEVMQFLSYGGKFIAASGPAEASISRDIGVAQSRQTPGHTSLQLIGNGHLAKDFTWTRKLPRSPNACNPKQHFRHPSVSLSSSPSDPCVSATTPINKVQGAGFMSPMINQNTTIQGVVTADFQSTSLQGFAMQEEDAGHDSNPLTSEGIFVFSTKEVKVGDLIQVTGKVTESFDLTSLTAVSTIKHCASGTAITPAPLTLPLPTPHFPERLEGMLVDLGKGLTVTDNRHHLYRGELVLSNGRLFQPTHIVPPGRAARAAAKTSALNQIILDDHSNRLNPWPLINPDGRRFNALNPVRTGSTLIGTVVMDYAYGRYRLRPVKVNINADNPRRASPKPVSGRLKVATFNLLNYFTTLDEGVSICGPRKKSACRGADSQAEFTRQRKKIIRALKAINADIIGLIELENNTRSSLQNLIDGLGGAYDFINTGPIGSDAIKVGILYKENTVTPVGSFAVLDLSPRFPNRNRPALAQTFQENASREIFTLSVSHFRSKAAHCGKDDPDTGDGQGNCNLTRTRSAQALADWLTTHPTGHRDPDIMIIGDLNAYRLEDPIRILREAGYSDLLDPEAYSYAFNGKLGYLDHALVTPTLYPQVTGITVWHINADEPVAINYNVEGKSHSQLNTLYSPDPYRSSDHDPLLIGLTLEE